jgi:hypothetical protein
MLIDLAHPIGGRHEQRIKECSHNSHILAGPGDAATPQGCLSWPNLPRAPIHIGVGHLVWPQYSLTHRRVCLITVLLRVQSRLVERIILPPVKPSVTQGGVWLRYDILLWHCWYGLKHRGFLRQSIVAMGIAEVTTLHARGMGKPELPPLLEAESSSLGDSLRLACSDGDPLRTMPSTMARESFPSGGRLKLSKWSMLNSRSSKLKASPWVSSISSCHQW